ncbi:hypothetical protein P3T37_006995 [Kitasatospora sp. MAA4]|uniref:hypothetical protein n=1 Tax=Kitasatospora sp. MAA4 TaxID=3035093 RepID=UPI0024744D5E|nr:hypothetical protein [Kitasatospora sp. MAA4]MDH6137562.1 hypothetical protein [Kitasatospora sp. MAA4]
MPGTLRFVLFGLIALFGLGLCAAPANADAVPTAASGPAAFAFAASPTADAGSTASVGPASTDGQVCGACWA